MIKKIIISTLVILLLLFSLFPRSVEVLNGNPVFEIDQGRDYMAVKNIVVNHKLTLIGAELGAGDAGLKFLFHGPGYFYLLTIPFIIFKGNPIGGVYLMLLLGISAIAAGVFFVSRFWGEKYGFLMGFLLAVCPYLIGQSRFIENHFPTPIFILLVFYYVYRLTQNKKKKKLYIFLASFISAFIYNFEFAIAVPLSISLIVYSIFLFKKKFFSSLPFLLTGFSLGFSPLILFELRHGSMGIKNLFNYLFFNPIKNYSTTYLFSHAQHIYNLFTFSLADSFPGKLLIPNNVLSFVLIIFFSTVVFVWYKEKETTKKNFILFLIILFPVNFFTFMFLRNIVFQHYITDIILTFLFFVVIILSWLDSNNHKTISMFLFVYFILLIALGGYNGIIVAKSDYYDYGGVHKLKGKLDAIDYIYKDANKKPFGFFVFTPGVYTYPYDYLVWWRGEKKYGYYPNNQKKDTFYLLIEKDIAQPWSYIGWKQTVIKEGKISFQKTLKSELIVEKRISE